MKTNPGLYRTAKWLLIYVALITGMIWLHDPFKVSMDAAESTVTFVYQQF